MALDPKTIKKPFRELRKLLKNFPDPPEIKDVHDVRTHTRKIEAFAGVFGCVDSKSGKKVVKTLKPIRRAAGDVRDMDVLTELAASLDADDDNGCKTKLIQNISDRRIKAATKLNKRVNASASEARGLLKASGRLAADGLDSSNARNAKPKDKRKSREKSSSTMTSALGIEQELRDWPNLTEKNLHPFRLKAKELHYVLKSAKENDSDFIDSLGEVKDQIGLWHDWSELSAIASEVIDHGTKCPVTVQIRSRTSEELKRALVAANHLRAQYLQVKTRHNSDGKRTVAELHPIAISAASRIAS